MTNVHFHNFALDVSTTDETEDVRYPAPRSNTYKVRDLLRMANVQYEEVRHAGALLLLNMIFDCQLDDETCSTTLESANLDSKVGYNYAVNRYFGTPDGERRDTYRLFGLRIATL